MQLSKTHYLRNIALSLYPFSSANAHLLNKTHWACCFFKKTYYIIILKILPKDCSEVFVKSRRQCTLMRRYFWRPRISQTRSLEVCLICLGRILALPKEFWICIQGNSIGKSLCLILLTSLSNFQEVKTEPSQRTRDWQHGRSEGPQRPLPSINLLQPHRIGQSHSLISTIYVFGVFFKNASNYNQEMSSIIRYTLISEILKCEKNASQNR